METNVIGKNKEGKNNGNTMKTAGIAAAAAVAGAGTALGAEMVIDDLNTEKTEETAEQTQEQAQQEQAQQTQTQSQPQTQNHTQTQGQTQSQAQPQNEAAPQDNANATTQENSTQAENNNQDTQTTDTVEEEIPEIDPDEVADALIEDIEVDPTDIDTGNLDIASVGTVTTIDGQILQAAQFSDPEGEELYLVDINDDNVYDIVTNTAGEELSDVPGTLTVSDGESLIGENSGEPDYLPQTDTDLADTDMTQDMMNDIVNLDTI